MRRVDALFSLKADVLRYSILNWFHDHDSVAKPVWRCEGQVLHILKAEWVSNCQSLENRAAWEAMLLHTFSGTQHPSRLLSASTGRMSEYMTFTLSSLLINEVYFDDDPKPSDEGVHHIDLMLGFIVDKLSSDRLLALQARHPEIYEIYATTNRLL